MDISRFVLYRVLDPDFARSGSGSTYIPASDLDFARSGSGSTYIPASDPDPPQFSFPDPNPLLKSMDLDPGSTEIM